MELLRHPVTWSETPAGVHGPPPNPGEHTREVLAELGLGDQEVEELLACGAAGDDRREDPEPPGMGDGE